jgi:hypothetical protein
MNTGAEGGYLLYNPTEDIRKDLAECADGNATGRTKISTSTAELLRKTGVDFSTATIHMHSQGGIIGTNAIDHLGDAGVDINGMKTRYYMAGSNRRGSKRKIGKHGVTMSSWYQNGGDAVSTLAGGNAFTDLRPDHIALSLIASPTLFYGGRRNSNHSLNHGAIKGYAKFTNFGKTWTPESGWSKGLPEHLQRQPKHLKNLQSYGK